MSSREKAVAGAVGHYARFLVGRDPMQSGALWQEMYRSQYFEGGRVLSAAISAIDIALYDIKGKALDVPVYELLGGKQRDFVAGFITTALPGSTEESERMQALVDAGWPAVRFSAPPPTRDGVYDPRRAVGGAGVGDPELVSDDVAWLGEGHIGVLLCLDRGGENVQIMGIGGCDWDRQLG